MDDFVRWVYEVQEIDKGMVDEMEPVEKMQCVSGEKDDSTLSFFRNVDIVVLQGNIEKKRILWQWEVLLWNMRRWIFDRNNVPLTGMLEHNGRGSVRVKCYSVREPEMTFTTKDTGNLSTDRRR